MELVKPKNGNAMETIGIPGGGNPRHYESIFNLQGLYRATRLDSSVSACAKS